MTNLNIITPVFNQSFLTEQCLTDMKELSDGSTVTVTIVDNGSSDNTSEIIDEFIGANENLNINRISLDKNYGFAKACNIGYSKIEDSNSIICFLNNDIRVKRANTSNWASTIIDIVKANENKLISPTGGLIDKGYNFLYETNDPKSNYNYLSGWCLIAKKSIFDIFVNETHPNGPFIEDFTTYFEDTYIGFEARYKKIPMEIISAPFIHIGRVTSKAVGISSLYSSAKQKFIAKCKEMSYEP